MSSLSATSDERKARLAKLASLKRKQQPSPEPSPAEEEQADANDSNPAIQHLSLRNYDPETRGPKLGFETGPPISSSTQTLEEQAQQIQEQVNLESSENNKGGGGGIDLFKLQPKKPNWDLKRELNAKMEVLNVRTDNAIARMVRERLASKKKESSTSSQNKEDAEADGVLDGTAIVEGIKLREREEEEEIRREREAEEEEFGVGGGNA